MSVDLHQCFRVDPGDLPDEAVIFGRTEPMRAVLDKVGRVQASDLPVLLQGERGTGKDLVARFLHARSNRREGPFVKLSCAAMPQRQLEVELLGSEAGDVRPGLVEIAEGGTLFLDEVGEIDPTMQRKLLLLLRDGCYFRVGGREERQVPVRIVCSSNVQLAPAVAKGRFRRDLFEHLEGVSFRLAALRERKEDIPLLWEFFAQKLSAKFQKSMPRLTPALLRMLEEQDWPGNLCELENCIARIIILGHDEAIAAEQRRKAGVGGSEGAKAGLPAAAIARIIRTLNGRRSPRLKTTEELKRSQRSPLYRLKVAGGLQRLRSRKRFPRPD